MSIPRRVKHQSGRHALVDGIPFCLPVNSEASPALMAAFKVDHEAAQRLMPGNELHPFRYGGHALLLITVIDYRITDIGKYIEYSIAIACTYGRRPAPRLLPLIFQKRYGLGQYVHDLPVSSEISVKGGKGIWGMPKHRASLDFVMSEEAISSQYDLDGEMVMRIDMQRPKKASLPLNTGAANYCQFRGMLMKSYIYFRGRAGFTLGGPGRAAITLGTHTRAAALRALGIRSDPVFTAFFPSTAGVLDDHFEAWFLSHAEPPQVQPEGLESVVRLGLGEEWLESPRRVAPVEHATATSR